MPFASKSVATMKNGKVRKGFREITDSRGNVRYMTDNKPKKDVKPKAVKPKPVKKKSVFKKTKKEELIDPVNMTEVE